MYKNCIKRILDVVFSAMCFPFVLLLIIVMAPIIYVSDPGPVFYNGLRRGLKGKTFKMYKFRTMYVNAPDIRNKDGSTYNADNDPRVTKVGRFMRKTSIDEIPQIINVFKGDMSFIGPRPVTVDKNLKDLDEIRRKRLEVRPGITGYSQAYYRNSISQNIKLRYDAEYAENISFKKDLQIFFKTIGTVLRRKNIYKNE